MFKFNPNKISYAELAELEAKVSKARVEKCLYSMFLDKGVVSGVKHYDDCKKLKHIFVVKLEEIKDPKIIEEKGFGICDRYLRFLTTEHIFSLKDVESLTQVTLYKGEVVNAKSVDLRVEI